VYNIANLIFHQSLHDFVLLFMQEMHMGTYTLEHIIREWKKGELTADQVIGQILLMIQDIQKQLAQIESRLIRLEKLPGDKN